MSRVLFEGRVEVTTEEFDRACNGMHPMSEAEDHWALAEAIRNRYPGLEVTHVIDEH